MTCSSNTWKSPCAGSSSAAPPARCTPRPQAKRHMVSFSRPKGPPKPDRWTCLGPTLPSRSSFSRRLAPPTRCWFPLRAASTPTRIKPRQSAPRPIVGLARYGSANAANTVVCTDRYVSIPGTLMPRSPRSGAGHLTPRWSRSWCRCSFICLTASGSISLSGPRPPPTGLPIAVRSDGGTGLEFPPTPVGYPRFFIEYNTFASANFATHLASLITEGVFEKYPELKFVFADGGHDLLTQLIWRLDTTFPACRGETPWVKQMPSEYLAGHVRFVSAKHERPVDPAAVADWARISQVETLLMFGSHYPHWTTMRPDELFPELPEATRHRLLVGNAMETYGDRIGAGARAS